MKKVSILGLLLGLLAILAPGTDACVGKMLNVGVVDSTGGRVLAEMVSAIINERTGTTVSVKLFHDAQALDDALKVKQVDISIENTGDALRILNRPSERDINRAFEIVKSAYEKEKGLVWLKPFGFLNGNGSSPTHTAAVLRVDILTNFPALPRVIGKLGTAINDEAYTNLIRSIESGEKPKKVARDFLKAKKLI